MQPGFNILYRGPQKLVAPAPSIWVGQRPPLGMCIFLPLEVLRVQLYLQFLKAYPPLLLRPTRGLSHLSRDQLCWQLLLQL